jgi:hypothetical protein
MIISKKPDGIICSTITRCILHARDMLATLQQGVMYGARGYVCVQVVTFMNMFTLILSYLIVSGRGMQGPSDTIRSAVRRRAAERKAVAKEERVFHSPATCGADGYGCQRACRSFTSSNRGYGVTTSKMWFWMLTHTACVRKHARVLPLTSGFHPQMRTKTNMLLHARTASMSTVLVLWRHPVQMRLWLTSHACVWKADDLHALARPTSTRSQRQSAIDA